MIPELIEPMAEGTVCHLVEKWRISRELAESLVYLARNLPFGLQIISGYRSEEEQEKLREEGRPTAPPGRSTHTSCPATGADLMPVAHPADQIKLEMGRVARLAGLRWGGGSPIHEKTGIPSDWNHFDLGPRAP
jgi:hypothetical protein